MSMRIIIADDHPLVRVGMASFIEAGHLGEVVAVARTASELLGALRALPCDVVLTDLWMPGHGESDGFGMLLKIRQEFPNIGMVLFSGPCDLETAEVALECGVDCVVDKASSQREVLAALHSAFLGIPRLSTSLFQSSSERLDAAVAEERANQRFTLEELQVLTMHLAGSGTTEIALRLDLEPRIVLSELKMAIGRLKAAPVWRSKPTPLDLPAPVVQTNCR